MGILLVPPHHQAWLKGHPGRTEAWLRGIIRQGFDIHHLDRDPNNNDPDNLVLIEAKDHQRIHGKPNFNLDFRLKGVVGANIGVEAYERAAAGATWRQVTDLLLGEEFPSYHALSRAREYASDNGLKWPLKTENWRSKRKKLYDHPPTPEIPF